jgi:hypothetical protein
MLIWIENFFRSESEPSRGLDRSWQHFWPLAKFPSQFQSGVFDHRQSTTRKFCFKIPNRQSKFKTVPVVQRIEQGFPKGKTAFLHSSTGVISHPQASVNEPVDLLLRSSRVITNLRIFTYPVTQRVTQISAPFLLVPAYDCARDSTLQNNLRLQLRKELAGAHCIELFASRF